MDERIDILNAEGAFTGKTAMKSEAHLKGWYHASVHVWVYTDQGEVLLQQRAFDKDTFPGYWDVSVAGHIGAGETALSSAQREVFEEIGLDLSPTDLKFQFQTYSEFRHGPEIMDREFHDVFLAKLKLPLSNLQKQESEVADIKLFSLEVLLDPGKINMVPNDSAYYKRVYELISEALPKKD